MNATIVEVARKSGTSLSTVSRVLSNSAYPVNEKTRKRVVEAAEALGYRPNSAARMLRSRRSMYIAAIVPSLNNPFYSSIISAIEREVLSSGYMMQLYSSDNDAELENRLLDLIGSVQAAAILISSINWDEKLEKKVRELGIPAVFFEGINTLIKQVSVDWESYSRGDKIGTFIMIVVISGFTGFVLDCIYEQFILISYKYNIETTTLVSILVFYCLISNIIWTKNKLKSKTDK